MTEAPKGQRNAALYAAAVALGQLVAGSALTAEDVTETLLRAARRHIAVHAGARGNSYKVRWSIERKRFKKAFRTKALADSYRSELVSAQRNGEAFVTETGLPVSMARSETKMSRFDFACSYVDNKWPSLAGNSRRSTAHALTAATLALLVTERGRPEMLLLRKALISWAFNTRTRAANAEPPRDIQQARRSDQGRLSSSESPTC